MTATISVKDRNVWGDTPICILDITLDSSYPAGGYPMAETDIPGRIRAGVGTMRFVEPNETTAQGYVAQYDYTNKKLRVFRNAAGLGALVEVAGGVDLHLVTFRCLIVGDNPME